MKLRITLLGERQPGGERSSETVLIEISDGAREFPYAGKRYRLVGKQGPVSESAHSGYQLAEAIEVENEP